MNRLVSNQQNRRDKQTIHYKNDPNINMFDERTFYVPRFFDKEVIETPGEPISYKFTPIENKYWAEREKGTWENVPRIYDDNCDVFYQ